MAAGTVITGGFPGRVALEVLPNEKCNGCLHFDGQAGRTGACTIGLKPFSCGDDGSMADIGYAPIARGAGSYLPDMNTHGAHAPEAGPQEVSDLYGSGPNRPVTFQEVSLGEEHVRFVKSMFTNHVKLQQSMCRLCKSIGTIGAAPANTDPQSCTCEPIAARDIAKSLMQRLSNRERSVVDLEDATAFVYEVIKGPNGLAKGTFYHAHGKYEVTSSGKGDGKQHVDYHPKSGGEPTRIGTYPDRNAARAALNEHGKRFAAGTGGTYEHSNAKVTPTSNDHTKPTKVAKSDDVEKAGDEIPHHIKQVHAFVKEHGYRATAHADHVKIHIPYRNVHTGEEGVDVHHASNMKQAREHLGY